MSDGSNLDRLKAAYKAWIESKGAGSEPWLALFDDDFRLCSMDEATPGLSFAKDRHSKQEAVNYLTSLLADWTMVHWTPETFVCEGDNIAMFGRCAWTNKATGKTAEIRVAHLWEFRGSRIVGLTDVFDSGRAAAAAVG